MKLLIIGLRRSGTTILWKQFRQHKEIKCFDEPFNPRLVCLPKQIISNVWNEYIDLINEDADLFWKYFSPICVAEEVKNTLSKKQIDYFKYILNTSEKVVINETRINFKIHEIKKPFPDLKIIYINRKPQAWVSSHILPSRNELSFYEKYKAKILNIYNRFKFWELKSGYNIWDMEYLTSSEEGSLFYNLIKKETSLKNIEIKFAYQKLLLFWYINHNKVKTELAKHNDNEYYILEFEKFAKNPKIINNIIEKFDFNLKISPKNVRQSNNGFKPEHINWHFLKKTIKS